MPGSGERLSHIISTLKFLGGFFSQFHDDRIGQAETG
jgi:hypothetical protein